MADVTLARGYREPSRVMRAGLLAAGRFSPRMAASVWMREVMVYRHIWPSTILSNLFDPVIYLLAMGFGLGAFLEGFDYPGVGRISYLQFIAPGLLASSIMMASAFEMAWNTYIRIKQERLFEAMLTTPATTGDIVAGEMLWATTRSVIYTGVLLAVFAAFHLAGFPLFASWGALLLPVAAVLGGLLFAVVGLSYTALLDNMEYLTFYFTLFLTPQFLFSGIFFPLPAWASGIAWFIPLAHLVDLCRGLMLGAPLAALLGDALWLAGAIALLWSVPHAIVRRKLIV